MPFAEYTQKLRKPCEGYHDSVLIIKNLTDVTGHSEYMKGKSHYIAAGGRSFWSDMLYGVLVVN